MDERPAMTVREAGQRGGEAAKRKYGSEFYSLIGRNLPEADQHGKTSVLVLGESSA